MSELDPLKCVACGKPTEYSMFLGHDLTVPICKRSYVCTDHARGAGAFPHPWPASEAALQRMAFDACPRGRVGKECKCCTKRKTQAESALRTMRVYDQRKLTIDQEREVRAKIAANQRAIIVAWLKTPAARLVVIAGGCAPQKAGMTCEALANALEAGEVNT